MQVNKKSNIVPLHARKVGPRVADRRLAFMVSEGMHILHWSEISYCSAESNYCKIHCADGSVLLVSKTLKAVESALPDGKFFRVHQSFLVRLDQIRMLLQDCIVLIDKTRIPSARSRRAELHREITKLVAII